MKENVIYIFVFLPFSFNVIISNSVNFPADDARFFFMAKYLGIVHICHSSIAGLLAGPHNLLGKLLFFVNIFYLGVALRFSLLLTENSLIQTLWGQHWTKPLV